VKPLEVLSEYWKLSGTYNKLSQDLFKIFIYPKASKLETNGAKSKKKDFHPSFCTWAMKAICNILQKNISPLFGLQLLFLALLLASFA
jgi:uncharacterized membrane protein